ncbi:MAG: hypothetical protein ATN33_06645 [Epulopiscium sp. Nele67-Bin001]|nr:MAG: hypothetical protein BEN18_06055 [Epulopiscium sp. Nuni2H_MBin001]OON92793.1 MAG: hypothetical protein ATN33_06645 [Epulopiscium sp. Nele67-Bin001]
MDLVLILKVAGIGLGIWAIQEILQQADMKSASSYVGIIGTLVLLMFMITEIVNFFETVQTFFTF